jgi:LacI family transcriptional regulator
VPEDVQVIGFDGIKLFEDAYFCSTIVQPLPEIARMCVDLLLQDSVLSKPPLVCLPVSFEAGGTTRDCN